MTRKKTKRTVSTSATTADVDKVSITRTPSVLERLAIFGDSGLALAGSFVVFLLAISASWNLNDNITSSIVQTANGNSTKFEILYQKLGPAPAIDPPRVYSIEDGSFESIHQAYKKDGVVAVRGLIPTTLLDRLDAESRNLIEDKSPKGKKPKRKNQVQFHTMKNGAAFLDPPTSESQTLHNVTAFLEVAVLSRVPALASELMLPEMKSGETVRMMR